MFLKILWHTDQKWEQSLWAVALMLTGNFQRDMIAFFTHGCVPQNESTHASSSAWAANAAGLKCFSDSFCCRFSKGVCGPWGQGTHQCCFLFTFHLTPKKSEIETCEATCTNCNTSTFELVKNQERHNRLLKPPLNTELFFCRRSRDEDFLTLLEKS